MYVYMSCKAMLGNTSGGARTAIGWPAPTDNTKHLPRPASDSIFRFEFLMFVLEMFT